jgi:predicted nucleotidyltransferase component of viral defense system
MIPQAHIIEWSSQSPWQNFEQVEQDLLISRALIAIFEDDFLAEHLAFRGGTALYKLYLSPVRYSEDIDLVQIKPGSFGEIVDRLRVKLQFLGEPKRKLKENNVTLIFPFESEFPPVQKLKLKVETNCREHFSVMGWHKFPFTVDSPWFQGSCEITTYQLAELLGTKLRALYQRRKGRDLFDLYMALSTTEVDTKLILDSFRVYMDFVVNIPPTRIAFIKNMEAKMNDDEFLGDIYEIILPNIAKEYDNQKAFDLVKERLLNHI